ncbi:unnamed protein product [Fraxinus pennsylvanica]|uniref:Sulfotransferase n=1 Tax=Fraxinus pennsylvanica TaxID=56036 RepID=A0AAD1YTT6_9LAMI|nr:unnamed protein product [Fraxinus pennsylvanica]
MTAKTSLLPPMDLQEEDVLAQECKSLISSLPKEKGWISSYQYKYEGFWYSPTRLQQVITLQKHFLARNSDIILVTHPKSGTMWLKAIMFTLVNRKKHLVKENHPLLSKNPHELVPFFDFDLYLHNQIPDPSSIPSPRLFATHLPYFSLPKSLHNSASKHVYLCRNPKDTFVSFWHFINKLRPEKKGSSSLDEAFDMFYRGVSPYGPFWDHILD